MRTLLGGITTITPVEIPSLRSSKGRFQPTENFTSFVQNYSLMMALAEKEPFFKQLNLRTHK